MSLRDEVLLGLLGLQMEIAQKSKLVGNFLLGDFLESLPGDFQHFHHAEIGLPFG